MDQGWLVKKKQMENVILSCGFFNHLFQAEIMQSVKKGLIDVFAWAWAFNLLCFPVYMWKVWITKGPYVTCFGNFRQGVSQSINTLMVIFLWLIKRANKHIFWPFLNGIGCQRWYSLCLDSLRETIDRSFRTWATWCWTRWPPFDSIHMENCWSQGLGLKQCQMILPVTVHTTTAVLHDVLHAFSQSETF